MNVFLDTEFTDLLDPILISLGMVSERDEEFYIEVPYPDAKCTEFVRETVLPLLGREPHAFVPLDNVRLHILKWLEIARRNAEGIEICIDYETDWDLFCLVMDYRIPEWIRRKDVASDINELLLYSFFKTTGLPEHHALYDARANRYAYRPREKIQQFIKREDGK